MSTFMHWLVIDGTGFACEESAQRIPNAFLFLLLLITNVDTSVVTRCGILRTNRTGRILVGQ